MVLWIYNNEDILMEAMPPNTELDNLKAELENTKSQLNTTQLELDGLKGEKENFNNEIKSLKSQLEDKNGELIKVNNDLNSTKAGMGAVKSELEEVKASLDKAKEEFEAANNDLVSTKEIMSKLAAEKEDKSLKIQKLNKKISENESEIGKMKTKYAGSDDLLDELKILRILASAENPALDMYNVLKEYQSMELRKLAMQSGMALSQVDKLMKSLERAGLVKIERASADDPNPKLSLVS